MRRNGLLALTTLLITYASLIPSALANTEKTMFVAPGAEEVPQHTARRSAWYLAALPRLTHREFAARVELDRGFPNGSFPFGPETWFLLEYLTPGKRYEARISWAATQPTSFNIDAFTLPQVLEDEGGLFYSFSSYFKLRSNATEPLPAHGLGSSNTSRMLLRVQSAADYFTHDAALMATVPPVRVDIVLDPYVGNILPNSLIFVIVFITSLTLAVSAVVIWGWRSVLPEGLRSKGGTIMNQITLWEADRDDDTSTMNRDSDDGVNELAKGVYGWRTRMWEAGAVKGTGSRRPKSKKEAQPRSREADEPKDAGAGITKVNEGPAEGSEAAEAPPPPQPQDKTG